MNSRPETRVWSPENDPLARRRAASPTPPAPASPTVRVRVVPRAASPEPPLPKAAVEPPVPTLRSSAPATPAAPAPPKPAKPAKSAKPAPPPPAPKAEPAGKRAAQELVERHGMPYNVALAIVQQKSTLDEWHQDQARRQRVEELKTLHDMPDRWARRVARGVPLERWYEEQERRREAERAPEVQAEHDWTLQHRDDLTLVTYQGLERGVLVKLKPFQYRLEHHRVEKVAVVALLPGAAPPGSADDWDESVRSRNLSVLWAKDERDPFPESELQAAETARQPLVVVTRDGRRWSGRVVWNSRFAFLLDTPQTPVLLLKHGVFSVTRIL